ncbi:MAG TPA: antibiotic biosynthesis monooxygenase family protein [Gemmatimonadaceae bacterium]
MRTEDLVFYVEFHVKPEYVDEWKAAVTDVIEHMSTESTFVSCFMHEDPEDATHYTLYERWSEPSVEAFVKNQLEARSYRHAYEAKLPTMLQAPRKASVLRLAGEWRRSRAR